MTTHDEVKLNAGMMNREHMMRGDTVRLVNAYRTPSGNWVPGLTGLGFGTFALACTAEALLAFAKQEGYKVVEARS